MHGPATHLRNSVPVEGRTFRSDKTAALIPSFRSRALQPANETGLVLLCKATTLERSNIVMCRSSYVPDKEPSMTNASMRLCLFVFAVCLAVPFALAAQQSPEIKFIADTLVIQADGSYQTDPDLATVVFDISSQDKDLKLTYDQASASMQKIINLAEKNGLRKEDVSSGVLTVRPFYEGDRRKRAKSFLVHGEITLRVRDFSKLGPILEGSVEDGITDFRSLTYSLSDEEAAKQKAVAEAMKHAMGRATAALESKGQKVGGLRFVNVDVKQLAGLQEMNVYSMAQYGGATETVEVSAGAGGGWGMHKKAAAPPPPVPQPQKISVSAAVQCAFQIL